MKSLEDSILDAYRGMYSMESHMGGLKIPDEHKTVYKKPEPTISSWMEHCSGLSTKKIPRFKFLIDCTVSFALDRKTIEEEKVFANTLAGTRVLRNMCNGDCATSHWFFSTNEDCAKEIHEMYSCDLYNYHDSIKYVRENSIQDLIRYIKDCDFVVSAGNPYTILLARKYSKPVCVYRKRSELNKINYDAFCDDAVACYDDKLLFISSLETLVGNMMYSKPGDLNFNIALGDIYKKESDSMKENMDQLIRYGKIIKS